MLKKSTSVNTNTLVIQDIINYVEDNLFEELTPDIIARHFFMSISELNKSFKMICNMTLMEYVRNRRLSLAGLELLNSNIHIIDIAYKYRYETPESFTKAFTRFYGFPPSFVRRTYPKINVFNPLFIKIEIQGGWDTMPNDTTVSQCMPNDTTVLQSISNDSQPAILTKLNYTEQEINLSYCYNEATQIKGGISMENIKCRYHISLKDMQQKEDWRILLLLADKLKQGNIKFKVDGKTMIFAHGLEFKLEKICLTFKWNEETKVQEFFNYKGTSKSSFACFKYFDVMFEGIKVRCMFYGECPDDDTDEFLFRNAELVDIDGKIIYVQTLEFYYENAEPDGVYYKMVKQKLNKN